MTPIQQPAPPVVALEQLITSALCHLEEIGYTQGSSAHYAFVWRAFADFARDSQTSSKLTPKLAEGFLRSRGTSLQLSKRAKPSRAQKQMRRAVRVLLEFQTTGHFQRRQKQKKPESSVPINLVRQLERYEDFCGRHLRLSPTTLTVRRRTLMPFLKFLRSRGVATPGEIKPPLLSAYIEIRSRELQLRSLATQVGDIRSFLRFLCMEGLVTPELLAYAKSLKFSKEHHIPPVWPPETVQALLAAVDRASPVGKRNYAILLLACRMGLRAGDIRSLRLDDLCWTEARLKIKQKKTGRPLSLPLNTEVGEALIDYLIHGRPAVRYREVFLRAYAPFEPFSPSTCFWRLVDRTLRHAKIDLPPGLPRGLHSLRHTLATRLVQAGETLETVAGILGHQSIETTRIYTHLDVESLRSVALDPEEVFHE